MKEAKLANPAYATSIERTQPAAENAQNDIRVLDELELMLAGGGDHTDGWP